MKTTDILIIGSGIAGLSAAVKLNNLNPELDIIILTKANASDSNTRYAQGGIAAVMNKINDSYEDHIHDTIKSGGGLCDEKVVEMVVRQAPECIRELVALGVTFDQDKHHDFDLGLEGGHSTNRIVHHKDKTGFEIESVLLEQVRSRKKIKIYDNHTVVDLIITSVNGISHCAGAYLFEQASQSISSLVASFTILASGGCGQVYRNTTNPAVATGDGYAIAKRAGAKIKNMRFVQFHPTALYEANESIVSFLISEAIRGFGAHILDKEGCRFLFQFDKRGELATRDIVSAAIHKQMEKDETDFVYLDLRHLDPSICENHFPQITQHLALYGYDFKKQLIPIVPSAHYQCGGVIVDANAETNIAGLYAIGEVSCTGLHGTNRLASNSLLEALVYARNAAIKITDVINTERSTIQNIDYQKKEVFECNNKQIQPLYHKIKKLMSANFFSNEKENQNEAIQFLSQICRLAEKEVADQHYSVELLNLRNMAQTAILILEDIQSQMKDLNKLQIEEIYMSTKERTLTEPFKIKMVEPLKATSEAYRLGALRQAGYNPFLLRSDDVFIDLLTDSGTGAMSDKQWAGIMSGDESYAGARSWEHLERVVKDLTGMPYILPTHQGRAAERILYSILGGKDKVFISNTHFDTTRANIEFTGATAIDIIYAEAQDPEVDLPFKGDMDLEKLPLLIKQYGKENIAAVIITVTNNSAGGQPVSMANVKELRKICDENNLLLVIDGCRIAENAYFIKHREAGFENYTYEEIAKEMLRLGDAFIMSAKKDGLVNIGGLLTMKDEVLSVKCKNLLIISEGFTTYGGLAGRDMEALAIGLKEVFDADYLHYRIRSTAYLGEHLKAKGIPVVWPIGGHAVYVDAKKLYSNIPVDQYPGQALVCDLYIKGGIRCVEVGSVMFGKYDEAGKLIPAPNELVRLAIPRRVYTQSHIDFVLDVFDDILEMRNQTKGYKITYEPQFLRHFTAHFEKI